VTAKDDCKARGRKRLDLIWSRSYRLPHSRVTLRNTIKKKSQWSSWRGLKPGTSQMRTTAATAGYLGVSHTVIKEVSKIFEKWLSASSCLSVRPHRTSRSPSDRFSWSIVTEIFAKTCRSNSSLFKIRGREEANNGHLTWKPFQIDDNISLGLTVSMRNTLPIQI